MLRIVFVSTLLVASAIACGNPQEAEEPMPEPASFDLRVATFNIEDLRTEEVSDPASQRARNAAAVIQQLRPDVVLVNELTYDQPGGPAWE